MKCIKNNKTNEIRRVSNDRAISLVGSIVQTTSNLTGWNYCSKTEYKNSLKTKEETI